MQGNFSEENKLQRPSKRLGRTKQFSPPYGVGQHYTSGAACWANLNNGEIQFVFSVNLVCKEELIFIFNKVFPWQKYKR